MKPARAAAALCALLLWAGEARAQTIRIVEPEAWADGRIAPVPNGQAVRVAGIASHPAGVRRVTVNGREATLRPDREFPDLFEFEVLLQPAEVVSEVVVAVVPTTGDAHERRYRFDVPQAVTQPRTVPVDAPPTPWRPFRYRALGYAAAAGGGIALTLMEKSETREVCQTNGAVVLDCVNRTEVSAAYQGLGLGLLAAGVLGFAVDALMTSKKANVQFDAAPGRADRTGIRLRRPLLVPSIAGTQVHWLRVRF